jgi:hypothetical protein
MESVLKPKGDFCGKDPPWVTQAESKPIPMHLKASIEPQIKLQCISNPTDHLTLKLHPCKMLVHHSSFTITLKNSIGALTVQIHTCSLKYIVHYALDNKSNLNIFDMQKLRKSNANYQMSQKTRQNNRSQTDKLKIKHDQLNYAPNKHIKTNKHYCGKTYKTQKSLPGSTHITYIIINSTMYESEDSKKLTIIKVQDAEEGQHLFRYEKMENLPGL